MALGTRRATRRAFSLAELMVAIGILGIGLLLVAATFPVGIEQTRQITNNTLAPIIAKEAEDTFTLLLRDKTPRLTAATVYDPAFWTSGGPVTFRMRDLLTTLRYPFFTSELTYFHNATSYTIDLNGWLAGYYINPSIIDTLTPRVRSYPSNWNPNQTNEPPYTWAIVYRWAPLLSDPSQPDPNKMEIAIFAMRQTGKVPEPFVAFATGYPNKLTVAAKTATNLEVGTKFVVTNTFDDFGTGSGIAPFNAVVGKVMAIGDIPGSSAVDIEVQWTLDGTIIGSGYQIPSVFWAVPRDPALNGKSPLIDVFLRTIDVAE